MPYVLPHFRFLQNKHPKYQNSKKLKCSYFTSYHKDIFECILLRFTLPDSNNIYNNQMSYVLSRFRFSPKLIIQNTQSSKSYWIDPSKHEFFIIPE
jgi:hypothetical protein